jgi:isochorismate synthase
MADFAYYRLPNRDHYVMMIQHEGHMAEFPSCASLDGRDGFVIAPFMPSPEHPILLIQPDEIKQVKVGPALPFEKQKLHAVDSNERMRYAIDFANFHAQLESGRFSKIVLARCARETVENMVEAEELFLRACRMYPRMMVTLVSTEKSGTWLMATPELLLECNGEKWKTIALAGTMKLTGKDLKFDTHSGEDIKLRWSEKNLQEQQYVVTYITECLEQFTSDFHEEGPYTSRAANLVHLRSDFTFTLKSKEYLGDVINTLYPTPAVCGIPKDNARRFIIHNEFSERDYYSGFVGPISAEGETHLYVSLRCMKICDNEYRLYAGGGLLLDSVEQQEWDETEDKLCTMRALLEGAMD